MNNDLPTGTVTFLFTDIEGSTQLWERYPEAMKVALARHDELLRWAVESHNGHVVKTTGDGAYAVFPVATDASWAALDFQRSLTAVLWPELSPDTLRVRAGLHTGEAELRAGDYHGSTLNRAARIMSIGHGGQILLSATAAQLASGRLPSSVMLRDLGQYRLRGLAGIDRIFQLTAGDLIDSFPPLNAPGARMVNLPQQPTEFVGRWEEVAETLALLDRPDVRLVTLIGPGGMGKTRLGIQVATTLAERDPDRFTDGVFFVPLVSLSAAEGTITAIAAAIGFQINQQAGNSRMQLLAYLLSRSLLLVLDNMEQLVAVGGADLVAAILDTASNVRLLVTSRSRLGIQGEHLYNIPGMRLPEPAAVATWTDPDTEARHFGGLRLFRQAAGRIRPNFRLTHDNIADVTRIGRQVQGMPLGIELAAGWLELLSPAEIADEIDRCLDVLATDLRGVPDRQRSMRAVFDTTWTLLSDRERKLIPALSVFRAPFTRDAAGAVSGAGLADLLALTNKSWLQRVKDSDGNSRFLVHELLRQYAAEKLLADPVEKSATYRRFADFYADGLVRAMPHLRGAEQLWTRDQISADMIHVRFAWHWFLDQGDYESLTTRMMLPLYFYDEFHLGGSELLPLVTEAAARRQQASPGGIDLILCTLGAGLIASFGTIIVIPPLLEEIWAMVQAIPDPLRQLGFWYIGFLPALGWINQFDEGARRLREIISGPLPPEQEWLRTEAKHLLGQPLLFTISSPDETDEPVALLSQAAETYRRAGDYIRYGFTLGQLAGALIKKREFIQALALLEEQKTLLEPLGLGWRTWPELANLYLKTGQIDKASAVYGDASRHALDSGDLSMYGYALSWESIFALRFDTPERARRTRMQNMEMAAKYGTFLEENITDWSYFELGEIERVIGNMRTASEHYEVARLGFTARKDLTGQAYYERGSGDLALAAGDPTGAARRYARSLELLPVVISFHGRALALARLSLAETEMGDYQSARDHLIHSLRIVDANSETDLGSHAVMAAAELALGCGFPETALGLAAALLASPFTWNEVRTDARQLHDRARGLLDGSTAAVAEAGGLSMPLETLVPLLVALPEGDLDTWLDGVAATLAQPAAVPDQETQTV